MALSVRIQPIRRDIELMIASTLSPAARSAAFAKFARSTLAEVKASNTRILGREPPYNTYVDGVEGASEDQVKPEGRIIYEFELFSEVLAATLAALEEHSPRRSGRFSPISIR